ncbi:MAG: hypothetical protein N2167_04085 [Flavobacteriales bacterium]|nr:hypothetical protein [Flavobacteriales bacterium]
MNLFKITNIGGKIIAGLLVLLGLISSVMIYSTDKDHLGNQVEIGLSLAYIGSGLILGLILVFIIRGIILNPKSVVKSAISVGVLVALFVVFYQMASDHVTLEGKSLEMVAMVKAIPSSTIKLVDAGLNTLYTLVILSFVAIIGTEIWKIFK